MPGQRTVRGLGLISGGLDSMLAARLLMEQGIEVTGIAFVTPFFARKTPSRRPGSVPLSCATSPRHIWRWSRPASGYGQQMNPHRLPRADAQRRRRGHGRGGSISFHRRGARRQPMSQSLRSLNRVANLSSRPATCRPLSALRLKETVVGAGKVVGRSCSAWRVVRAGDGSSWPGVGDHHLPESGRRLLTDPGFAPGPDRESPGRRARPGYSRSAGSSASARSSAAGRNVWTTGATALRGRSATAHQGVPGPVMILSGAANDADIAVAAGICARYSDGRSDRCGSSSKRRRPGSCSPIRSNAELVARRIWQAAEKAHLLRYASAFVKHPARLSPPAP
jgi:hypothetical protein